MKCIMYEQATGWNPPDREGRVAWERCEDSSTADSPFCKPHKSRMEAWGARFVPTKPYIPLVGIVLAGSRN